MIVIVATRVAAHAQRIEQEGFRLIPIKLRRRSRNPVYELTSIVELVRLYRRERPDVLHHVALKPVLYGAIAAWVAGVQVVVSAMAGLGYVFSSEQRQAKIIKYFVRVAFKWLLDRPGSCVLLQNPDDRNLLLSSRAVARRRICLIRGSGVDTKRFTPLADSGQGPVVLTLVARMLRDKGIAEFVEASRILRQEGLAVKAVLVGIPDPENPTSIPESQLRAWQSEGWVEWWGQRDDIPAVWAQSHIAVLPSTYGEGVPMSLIEAAACGRPIVATDMPGCREIVNDGISGFLVPVKDPVALAEAIRKLVFDPDLRQRMGAQGRKLVEDQFSEQIVVGKTLALYRSLFANR
jgi:glycosyltransferase involved in cell wall biosynthesis